MGSNSTRPSFFIVGAPKCGTTALCNYLRTHPSIFIPERKEFHFFGNDLNYHYRVSILGEYLSYFSEAPEHCISGEGSVWYLYSRTAAHEIHRFDANAKIIVMIRNPIDMIQSLHAQWLYNGYTNIEDLEVALRVQDISAHVRMKPHAKFRDSILYKEAARYTNQIRRYVDVFGWESICVIVYDDFQERTEEQYKKVLNFLGVAEHTPAQFYIYNQRKAVRSRWFKDLAYSPPASVLSLGRRLVPDRRVRRWMRQEAKKLDTQFNQIRVKPVRISEWLLRELQHEYQDEIRDLSALLNRDFSDWINSRV